MSKEGAAVRSCYGSAHCTWKKTRGFSTLDPVAKSSKSYHCVGITAIIASSRRVIEGYYWSQPWGINYRTVPKRILSSARLRRLYHVSVTGVSSFVSFYFLRGAHAKAAQQEAQQLYLNATTMLQTKQKLMAMPTKKARAREGWGTWNQNIAYWSVSWLFFSLSKCYMCLLSRY